MFVEVTISIERAKAANKAEETIAGLNKVPELWRTGVLFGLSLLRESLNGKVDFRHISITVTFFQGQPCDTMLMAAAYASFHASAKALGVNASEPFRFGDSTGNFIVSLPGRQHRA